MTLSRAIFVAVAMILANSTKAEPPKKGRVLCKGEACRQLAPMAGGYLNDAWGFFQDLKERTVPRVVLSNEKKPASGSSGPRKRIHAGNQSLELGGNLPSYFAGVDRSAIEASDKVVFVPKSHDPTLKGLKSGDVVWAVVEQEITASPEVPTPIRAIAVSGPFKGGYFVGEATLDRELKRVLLSFSKLRLNGSDTVYSLKAAGLSTRGSMGLEGDYVSQTGKFFVAELASAAAAGFVDSTISRNQTALGAYVQEPSATNAAKSAAVSALSKTTARMADGVRQAPEFTHLQGYQEIQIMIQDSPVESGI